MILKRENQPSDQNRFEKIHTVIVNSASEGSSAVAEEIANLIKAKASKGQNCVLGLATGSTPTGIYDELVRLHREEGLSFQNVYTFNLDEYYPMHPDTVQSYFKFMHEYLFDHVDIPAENIHIPDGTISMSDVSNYCQDYERKIDHLGGLDFQILGIGRTGHIGFNEPGSHISSRTRMVTLDHVTRIDAASDFFDPDNVPRKAITMGIGTILKAKRVILLAWGEGKSSIVAQTVEGPQSDKIPATYLQNCENATVILDYAASAQLTRSLTPWLVGSCNWDENLIRQAVVWLCQKTGKPILKLTDRDYNDNGMSDLVSAHGSSYEINLNIFNILQHTITGWPGGKPEHDDTNRPERSEPAKKRAIIFSPHPDDDVISMGGTFIRLHDQGHDVYVAYQTSGNIAVFDDDVLRFADFASDLNGLTGRVSSSEKTLLYDQATNEILNKTPGQVDSPLVRDIKGLIRKSEAKSACRFIGLKDEKARFLDLPFY